MPSFFSLRLLTQTRRSIRPDPGRDWLVLLTFSGVALASLLVYNMWLFETVAGGGVLSGEAVDLTPPVSPSAVTIVRTVFEQRASEEAKYVTGTYRLSDPSQ